MHMSHLRSVWQRVAAFACVAGMLFNPVAVSARPGHGNRGNDDKEKNQTTETPIKHLIVLIGENRTFDHLFATYVSPSGDHVRNLLSEGIINADGTPGEHFSKAAQFKAIEPFQTKYFISLGEDDKAPYDTLPKPTLNFSPSPATGEPLPFTQPPATPLALLADPPWVLAMIYPDLGDKEKAFVWLGKCNQGGSTT